MDSTFLLVTKIDQKSPIKDAELAGLADKHRQMLQKAKERAMQIQEKIDSLIDAKGKCTDLDQFRAIDVLLQKLDFQHILATRKITQTSIEIRNDILQDELRGKFRDITGRKKDPDLQVFFVSNTEYQKHLAGYKRKDPPIRDIRATGIPGVRRMLYDIPTRGKLTTLSRICTVRLPNIFNSIQSILTKSQLERKQEVEKLIVTVLSEDKHLVETLLDQIRGQFKDQICDTMKDQEPKWKQKAEDLLSEWQEYNAGTFTAFCRRNGIWKTPRDKKKIEWNQEILDIFAAKLKGAFNNLEDGLASVENEAITSIRNLYRKLQNELQASEGFQGVDEMPFFNFITAVRDSTIDQMSKLFNQLRKKSNQIRYAATLNNEESYSALAMEDTYGECMKISAANIINVTPRKNKNKVRKKSGAHAARCELIRKRLTGEGTESLSVFAEVAKFANDEFEEWLEEWRVLCLKKIKAASEAIYRDFDRRFEAAEVKDEADQEIVDELITAAQEGLKVIHGEMKEMLQECKDWEAAGR